MPTVGGHNSIVRGRNRNRNRHKCPRCGSRMRKVRVTKKDQYGRYVKTGGTKMQCRNCSYNS